MVVVTRNDPPRAVTMQDVARRAGVSIKTVSRVVNGQGEIAESTRQRVLATIAELGYRPNRIASALVTQRTRTVGLVIPDITNPFFPEVARGVQDVGQAKDYNIFVCNTDDKLPNMTRILHSLAAQSVDGIITFPDHRNRQELQYFADTFRPIVAINQLIDHTNVSCVMVDKRRGAKLAVEHLIERGHSAIGMLTNRLPPIETTRRVQGFRQALIEHGIPIVDEWIAANAATLSGGFEATQQLLRAYPQITAIFAYNDLMALGAIRTCRELGRRVPEDCAIIGFDDIQMASIATPSLTTISIDKYELGRQAMTRLLEMLDHPHGSFMPVEVEAKLIVRESA